MVKFLRKTNRNNAFLSWLREEKKKIFDFSSLISRKII